jgi:hypothetical protein
MCDTGDSLATPRPEAGMVDFSKIFPKDASVFLRYDSGGKIVNVAVTCLATFDKTNVMTLVWPEASGQAASGPPPLNARVECVAMLRGRLMQFPAKISGLHHDQNVTLMLALDPHCRIVNLRRHERYRVFGWVRFGKAAEPDIAEIRQEMDLSLGGFGTPAAETGWEVGQELEFSLHADVYSSEEHSQAFPSLELSGSVVIRRISKQSEAQRQGVGAEFSDLSIETFQRLKDWLATNASRLCAV